LLNKEAISEINEALRRGNAVEVKREKDNIVVIELTRKLKIKAPING
jgi:hypothetical protein